MLIYFVTLITLLYYVYYNATRHAFDLFVHTEKLSNIKASLSSK